jgi:hypothetical protein
MSAFVSIFRYWSGVLVLPGDDVLYANDPHVVEHVIMPDTHLAEAFQCPEGGIVLSRVVDGRLRTNYLEEPPDGPMWEDLDFVRRGDLSVYSKT